MPTKPSEKDSSTFTDKMIETAKAIPARVKKFADSVMGNAEVKPSPKPVAKRPKTLKKSRRPTTTGRKTAKKK